MFSGLYGDEEGLRRAKRVAPVRNMRNSYKDFNRKYAGKALIVLHKVNTAMGCVRNLSGYV